jgi:hypothetical protein
VEQAKAVLFFVIVFLGLFGVIAFAVQSEDAERQHCVTTGGRVARVHGGRGGWVCLRDDQ